MKSTGNGAITAMTVDSTYGLPVVLRGAHDSHQMRRCAGHRAVAGREPVSAGAHPGPARHRAVGAPSSPDSTRPQFNRRRSFDARAAGKSLSLSGTAGDCVQVEQLSLTLRRQRLLSDVSFTASRGSLTAIIGPSGAGKSTLANLIAGNLYPTSGCVTFEGHDLHTHYGALRLKIGLVPQDNILHQQLTVGEALEYAAELRLPKASREVRADAVRSVLDELELMHRKHTRVDRLSGGERKRASVAMELLTEPSLLILDEPTSGLDPALDRQVMSMLRRLADGGRVVLVVTHCLTNVHICDQVLFLTTGGKTAYCGPPGQISAAMGTANWADIFARVGADPEEVHRQFRARVLDSKLGHEEVVSSPASPECPARCERRRQFVTLVRRQLRLLLADRGYMMFQFLLPFILGVLTLLVPGHVGLGKVEPHSAVPDEPAQILMLLNVSAVFMGTALTIRDMVGERAIFRREQAVGLSASAYISAKIGVFGLAALLQTAVLTAIVVMGKSAPTRGAVVMSNSVVELYVTLGVTAVVAAVTGMVLSAAARSQDQILPMLVMSVMLSIVLAGGLIPVTGRAVLNQLSWGLPARWGFAASASTVDLRQITALVPANESLWTHSPQWWLLDMVMLSLLGIAMAAVVRWRIRLGAS
jgi:ABC-type multidrug transport system ATPase subunit